MITASDLRACDSVDRLCALFERLGYELSPFQLQVDEWSQLGIIPEIPADASLYHLTEIGASPLLVLESREAVSELCRELITRYTGVNAMVRPIVMNLAQSSRQLIVHTSSGRRRHRRLDVSLENPKQQDVDALNLVELYPDQTAARPVYELFERALDRESLTRAFFSRFRSAVTELTKELTRSSWSESEESCASEALLILSRILFLYFIQEKGWLDGNRRFLSDHFRRCIASGDEFFSTVLSPLFFGCLNTPAERRAPDVRILGRIPYLNGGLFEPSPFERLHPLIFVSNALMQSLLEDVFEHFSFTAQESGDEAAVIDPEMLGKVFESLMHADERLTSGSFYTPRAVVDVLTSRAIIHYLGGNDEQTRALVRSALVSNGPLNVSEEEGAALLRRLESLTVLDPACGSGAFLLAAMRTIERLTSRLSDATGVDIESGLRQRIVERCLYGVDLKPEAVRLCELRLWLAIVSDSNLELEHVPPLPNLDRNIMQGNSLLSPLDFLGDGRRETYRFWAAGLRQGEV